MKTVEALVLAWLLGFCVASAEVSNQVSLESLLEMPRGVSMAHVNKELKTQPRHQFSANLGGTNLMCVSYLFERPAIKFYFTFLDGKLSTITMPPPTVWETNSLNGYPSERPGSFDPFARMQLVLNQPDISSNAITAAIEVASQRSKIGSNKEEIDSSPLYLLTAPYLLANLPNMKADEERNELLRQQYDGLNFPIGSRVDSLTNQLGAPLSVTQAGERTTCIFGKPAPAKAKVPFSWLHAVFTDQKLSYLFSHDFLDPATKRALIKTSVPTERHRKRAMHFKSLQEKSLKR